MKTLIYSITTLLLSTVICLAVVTSKKPSVDKHVLKTCFSKESRGFAVSYVNSTLLCHNSLGRVIFKYRDNSITWFDSL